MDCKLRAPELSDASRDAQLWTIRQVAQAYGVTMRALRFYESRGLLEPVRPIREEPAGRGLRLYDVRQRRMLESILRAKKLGFTLAETRTLLASSPDSSSPNPGLPIGPSEAAARIALLEQQREALDRSIAELKAVWTPRGERSLAGSTGPTAQLTPY